MLTKYDIVEFSVFLYGLEALKFDPDILVPNEVKEKFIEQSLQYEEFNTNGGKFGITEVRVILNKWINRIRGNEELEFNTDDEMPMI